MQPYLESLLDYIDGAPPLKHDQEVSPRDSWIYVLTTYQIYSNN